MFRTQRHAQSLSARTLIVLAIIAVISGPAVRPARATKYAGEFLKIGVGARALGMGGGFVAIADDASASYWNPAGLANLSQAELLFMHAEQFGTLANHDFVGYAQPLANEGRHSVVGLSLIRFGVDDILVTQDAYVDANGNGRRDPDEPIRPDLFRRESDTEYGLLLSYARQTSTRLSLGGNVKLIRQALVGHSSFGMGLDLGAIFRPRPDWSIGVRLADVTSTRISWDTGRKESILPTLGTGISWTGRLDAVRGTITAGAGLANSFEKMKGVSQVSGGPWGADLQGGIEYWYAHAVAVRAGSDSGHFTAGAGLRFHALGADYAYLSNQDLDATHRISASVRF